MATQQDPRQQPPLSGPQRIPLVVMPENRSTSTDKDAKLVNGYVEKTPTGEYWIYKRPGVVVSETLSGTGRGAYNWNGLIYTVFGGTFYEGTTSKGAVDSTAGSFYTFSAGLGATPKLFFQNGVKAYTYDSSGLIN